MKDMHVSFDILSDLCDNALMSAEERNRILHHLSECPVCRLEYDCLRRTLCLLSELQHQEFCCQGLTVRTIAAIRLRHRRRLFLKVGPSVAATVAIIVGASLFRMDATRTPDMAYSGMVNSSASRVPTDTEEIVRCISCNRGKILAISEFFVEGEVSPERFEMLRKQLGVRKVLYSLVSVSRDGFGGGQERVTDMEVVSGGDTGSPIRTGNTGKRIVAVRFRVFR